MEVQEILKQLVEDIHSVIIATLDENDHPVTCAIDLMLYQNHKIYFLTARGKSFYQRLMQHKTIALTGIKGIQTMDSIAISLQGQIRNIGHEKLQEIFLNNPYMRDIYPHSESQEVLEVFEIYKCTGEYFDLSQKPIFRQSFSIGEGNDLLEAPYTIRSTCNGCLACYQVCPQHCIDITVTPITIQWQHCLHCGKCIETCPQKAIVKK
ncbi:4Fe-4S binding protein [Candidatus Stoquefichus massiliensis]|uniref:4Fe-4S binding protein n=1 Tax=Candidatus Stoquefichus massiliensis TaxID=1470350 RepID=UPI000480E3E1|nr:4Fe-4S binding protein [Candidatus Stoquefichus massiliensis]